MPNFEDVLKRISPILKRITYKLNGHSSFFNDDDLFQEAVLHLWQDFRAGKIEDKTDSYILQGCYFHLKNYLRKARPKANSVSMETIINEEGLELEDVLMPEDSGSSFDYLHNRLLVQDMRDNGLTPREKEVLSLFLDGLTVREIGARLGISHVRILKIKEHIKKKSTYLLDNC